jgi:3-oxoacyl-[acyl-carrier-protein] synthase II
MSRQMSSLPMMTGIELRVARPRTRAQARLASLTSPRVAIGGYGLVSPLGVSAAQTWDAVMAGRAIDTHGRVSLESHEDEPRIITLAIHAAREAVAAAGWSSDELSDEATAVIVGTSKGPVDTWLTAPPEHMSNQACVAAGADDVFGLAGVCSAVARDIGAGGGPRLTISAACASGLHALARACMVICARQVERAIVVAAESSLHPMFLQSFKRLGVLPKDGVGCRPFDEYRDGFLMSEAASAVCLTAREAAADGDAPAEVFVDRFALGGDATHLTGSDPDGQLLRHLIQHIAWNHPIDLVHAHGTGTLTNDPVELSAIDATVQGNPNVYSHKGALGHTLGAAGLVSVVLNCMAHERGVIPPNVRTERPLRADHVTISPEAVRRDVRRSLAIAAGFGGATAVVGLTSIARV